MTKLVKIAMLLSLCVVGGCTDAPTATRVLQENNFTDIQMTGYNLFACSNDDTYHTGFTAKSPNGHIVHGTVCAGLFFKNSTIRFE